MVGLAACSADCKEMWQIGVDVLPKYRHQGINDRKTHKIGVLFLVIGICVGETDDAPGAGGLGIIIMLCFCRLGWKVLHKSGNNHK